eukprot:CAMPEP_0114529794 /NCGR_PEP_ID=MMETSP0109-20121206/25062_1 /TAXON_ID=29199 /ORGANISM="Chlorarachnion reptans, Strain CCCM449" /LENGTH=174 /DNA_ID=CAMNT_0001712295 /DNA_START=539 /DNA_END=1064 /DNA_ORIENTATION=+
MLFREYKKNFEAKVSKGINDIRLQIPVPDFKIEQLIQKLDSKLTSKWEKRTKEDYSISDWEGMENSMKLSGKKLELENIKKRMENHVLRRQAYRKELEQKNATKAQLTESVAEEEAKGRVTQEEANNLQVELKRKQARLKIQMVEARCVQYANNPRPTALLTVATETANHVLKG